MKNSGNTLIEIIVTLSIIAIALSMCVNLGNSLKAYIFKGNVELCNNSILSIINSAKLYCKSKEAPGYIVFDMNQNNIRFFSNGKRIDKFDFPEDFKLYSINSNGNMIRIDKYGGSTDACTIKYKDCDGTNHTITMSVGTSYVEIKN